MLPQTVRIELSPASSEADGRALFDAFLQAVDDLKKVVGTQNVLADDHSRYAYGRTTLPAGTLPRAVVQPASTEEVQAVVRIAGRHLLALHPISAGKNWGYGDATAATHGQVILDLRRMNRILEVNVELAYATIEPGVTQGQLAEYLERHRLPLWMDATGAGPQASFIGNILERGFGHSPYGERCLHCCCFEVVLPDGQLLKTGFGRFPKARAAEVYKHGLGPALDGLFTQSNLGIVTRMTLWLMPKPECFMAFFFAVPIEVTIGPLVEALRPLRLSGTLRTPIHIANDLRLIAMYQAYPWKEMGGCTPMSREVREGLRLKYGIGAWSGSGAIYGSRREVAASVREVRAALRWVPKLDGPIFLNDRTLRWAERAIRLANRLGWARRRGQQLEMIRLGYGLLKGKPSRACLQSGAWRVRRGAEAALPVAAESPDPAGGFIWVSPILPMTSAHLNRVNALAARILHAHGFEYQVTLTLVTARALCAVISIAFDKRYPVETRRAWRCHDELLRALLEAGYPPYRLGTLSMPVLTETLDVHGEVIQRIKQALDPLGLLSPGHYTATQPPRSLLLAGEERTAYEHILRGPSSPHPAPQGLGGFTDPARHNMGPGTAAGMA